MIVPAGFWYPPTVPRPAGERSRQYGADGTHYILEIKQNGCCWRVAQTLTRFPQTGKKYYWLEASATINRRGTRIYWGANHNDQRERYVDLYQLTLPESWYRDLQGE